MTNMPAPALAAALLFLSLIGGTPVGSAPSLGARAPIIDVRTSCDENGRCYETGDPARGQGDDGERRRYDRDDDPPPPRDRRYEDPDDRGPPPRDYDRDAAPRAPYRGDRRDDDDE